jgi:hypothetical protein
VSRSATTSSTASTRSSRPAPTSARSTRPTPPGHPAPQPSPPTRRRPRRRLTTARRARRARSPLASRMHATVGLDGRYAGQAVRASVIAAPTVPTPAITVKAGP